MDEAEYQMAKLEEKSSKYPPLKKAMMAYGLFLVSFHVLMSSVAVGVGGEFGHVVSVSGLLSMILIAFPAQKLFRFLFSLPMALVAIISLMFMNMWTWETIGFADKNTKMEVFNYTHFFAYVWLVIASELSATFTRKVTKVPLDTLFSGSPIKTEQTS